ncbi:S41 family peptidase [Cecembia calidifontis]|uniref:C-terminal processing protease CtpA/Prc n=1 Tax=Cecembia calidifontis TaxID=1187080 RepID=A0A4V2F6Z5_9BACT|nr:S41 family peptidase [Cecembia calidifontis]RZS98039.1 C-terminal processing protease CtpA/Prc [Cecembia calidifontis]
MKTYLRKNLAGLSLAVLLVFGLGACQDKEDQPDPNASPNVAINEWIKDVMDEVYYWLEDMRTPLAKNSDPEDYFESLLNRPTDRFSDIFPDYQELMNSLQGVNREAGYEILLARESNQNENVLAFVVYTKKGSPAQSAGLLRGDIITQINGQTMTLSNYQSLLRQRSENHTVNFFRFDPSTSTYRPQPQISLQTLSLAENPNFLDTIYTVNNQKIGYVVYHFFAPGVDGDNRYDNQMDEIFGRFKAEGINHLILDFRYNGGGFVGSAVNLASLIAPNVTSQDIFSRTKYNSFLSQFQQIRDLEIRRFNTKVQNLGNTLEGNRVHIITSGRTASASELIINGLKPYMNVFLIGGRTVGKNVGSIAFEDEGNPNNKYGILPIVTMIFNKDGNSDYTNGFTPNIEANELSQQVLLPLGDRNEYLLSLAIQQITGVGARVNLVERTEIGSSFENKSRFGQIIEDKIQIKNSH